MQATARSNFLFGLLAAVCVLTGPASFALAQKKAPPPENKCKCEPDPAALKQWWIDQDRPRVAVVVRGSSERLPPGKFAAALEKLLRQQLNKAGIGLVDAGVQAAAKDNEIQRRRENEGDEVGAAAQAIADRKFGTDLLLNVELELHGDKLTVNYDLIDTRLIDGSGRFSSNLADVEPDAEGIQAECHAKCIVVETLDAMRQSDADPKQVMVGLTGLQAERAQELVEKLEALKSEGVEGVSFEADSVRDRADRVELRVWYKGRPSSFGKVLRSTLKGDPFGLDLKLNIQKSNLIEGEVYKDKAPAWWVLTENDLVAKDKLDEKRLARLAPNPALPKSPSIVCLVGEGVGGPALQIADPDAPEQGEAIADDLLVEAALNAAFGARQFDPSRATDLREKVAQIREEMSRTQSTPGAIESVRRVVGDTDFVLLVNRVNKGDGVYIASLIRMRSQTVVAQQSFPDKKYRKSPKHTVDPADADGIARYITGGVLEQLDKKLDAEASRAQVMKLTIRSAEEVKFDDVQRIATAIKNVRDVDGVDNVVLRDRGLASIDIFYKRSHTELLAGINEQLAKMGQGFIIENAEPTESRVNLRRVPIPQDPADPAPNNPNNPPAQPAAKADFQGVLAEVKKSVWLVIGSGPDGGMTGTAWTVDKGVLATNAHVAQGLVDLRKKAADAGNPDACIWQVRHGEKFDKTLTVTGVLIHPSYEIWGANFGTKANLPAPYDVALLYVSEDTGPALKLAGPAEYRAIAAGQPICYAGFPAEHLMSGSPIMPPLRSDLGTISAVTNEFFLSSSPERNVMLHYDLRGAGGCSGSPVVTAAGKVVALFSAGDVMMVASVGGQGVDVTRIGVGFTYGQRVDMLDELLKNRNKPDALRKMAESRLADWTREFEKLPH